MLFGRVLMRIAERSAQKEKPFVHQMRVPFGCATEKTRLDQSSMENRFAAAGDSKSVRSAQPDRTRVRGYCNTRPTWRATNAPLGARRARYSGPPAPCAASLSASPLGMHTFVAS